MEIPTGSPSRVAGSTISTHDISYTIKARVPGQRFVTHRKQILSGINAVFKSGMNAILGPTGCGKSTLLDVIAGRKDPTGLSGSLLVDGSRPPHNFKNMTGYVIQEDVVCGTLTVRENLIFSASLRLPSTISGKEKRARVDETLRELGLEKCADTKIGTAFIRGVSGGERKRTNIGMELIKSPSVLFLDEPTTGLDASTANTVMHVLRRLSLRGCTIIFSIHQPRFNIYSQFDYLTLLSLGRTVYHGSANESLCYFQQLGYICEQHNNPPDFFLDIIQGARMKTSADTSQNSEGAVSLAVEPDGYEMTSLTGITSNGKAKSVVNIVDVATFTTDEGSLALSKSFRDSLLHQSVIAEIDLIFKKYQAQQASGTEDVRGVNEYTTSIATQVKVVAQRTIKSVFRNPQTSLMQIGMTVIMSLLVGLIYLQIDNNTQSGFQNRAGSFFLTTMNMAFSSMSGIAIFIEEQSIFAHESASGYYRTSSYFVAKVLCDMLPMRLIPVTIYAVISYFMIGYQLVAEKFFIYYLTIFMTNIVGTTLTFMASGLSPIYAVANLVCILVTIPMMIFGGLLVNLDTLGDWISWLKHLSLFRYCMNALYINEMKDLELCTRPTNGTVECFPDAGNKYLKDQGIAYNTPWDLWRNHVALATMAVVFLFLSYILLRTMKKFR